MKLSIKSLVITAVIMWGGGVFLCGVANTIWPGYAGAFLQVLDSLYPGYHATGTFGSVIVAILYAVVDAAVCAALFGWLYNRFTDAIQAEEGKERPKAADGCGEEHSA